MKEIYEFVTIKVDYLIAIFITGKNNKIRFIVHICLQRIQCCLHMVVI